MWEEYAHSASQDIWRKSQICVNLIKYNFGEEIWKNYVVSKSQNIQIALIDAGYSQDIVKKYDCEVMKQELSVD